MKAADLYMKESGTQYFEGRAKRRSEETQRKRAAFFVGVTTEDDVVLDFGCGTGGVLKNLPAKRRIGVEISDIAAAEAAMFLDLVLSDLSSVGDGEIDSIISYHALEHVENPAAILAEFSRVLRPGGRLKIMVPCEMPVFATWHRNWWRDPDMHLYSWTPLTLGNLVSVCGFQVDQAEMVPISEGGRLGALFPKDTFVYRSLAYLKALRSGRFHSIVTAHK